MREGVCVCMFVCACLLWFVGVHVPVGLSGGRCVLVWGQLVVGVGEGRIFVCMFVLCACVGFVSTHTVIESAKAQETMHRTGFLTRLRGSSPTSCRHGHVSVCV